MKPFIKWVGGKRQLAQEIEIRIPPNYNTYYEPFIGGGAVFYSLKPNNAVIGDLNKDLISSYIQIKDNLEELVISLDNMEELHASSPFEYYTRVRNLDRSSKFEEISELERAARFLYLNKSSFNGMYRVNSKNENNVPWNKKEKIKLYEKENIFAISEFFNEKNIKIINSDFEVITSTCQKGDFIYFDPPYDLLINSTFDSYQKGGFGIEGQKRLANTFKELHKKGCFVMLSNHNTPLINELYAEEYFNIDIVKASRKINSNPSKRGLVEEVLIYNYELEGENMKKKEFEEVINNLKETIATPMYFSNFQKAVENVEIIENGLNLLDGLIGKEEPEHKLLELIQNYPEDIIRTIPILHAVRLFKSKSDNCIKYLNEETKELENIYFSGDNVDALKLVTFCKKSKLLEIFKNKNITSTKSYVTGVEVGLDSNARKNRTGFLMEGIVENILKSDVELTEIFTQINTHMIKEKFGIDLSDVGEKANKIFDFAFIYNEELYVVEVNFYSGGGSKLNETARSYKQIETEVNKIDGCTFIWITDGVGWRTARNNLRETYEHNKYTFTLEMLKDTHITTLLNK